MRWLGDITDPMDMSMSKLREIVMEKKMATHSSILAWKISWSKESGRLQVHGVARS